MKLNTTYPLEAVLDAITKASDNHFKVADELRKSKNYMMPITQFTSQGMLTTSAFARVTFTHKEGDNKFCGYMETNLADGPRTPVSVTRHDRCVAANDDWTEFRVIENNKVVFTMKTK